MLICVRYSGYISRMEVFFRKIHIADQILLLRIEIFISSRGADFGDEEFKRCAKIHIARLEIPVDPVEAEKIFL